MTRQMPKINWFELEILLSISKKSRYGQQLLNTLSSKLSENISSGRLYPVLQKLEKNGYIKRSEQEKGRFFYSITDKGKDELFGATQWALHSLLTTLTRKLASEVTERIQHHLINEIERRKEEENELKTITVFEFCGKPKAETFLTHFAEKYSDITFYCIYHEKPTCGNLRHTIFPRLYDDIPNIVEMNAKFEDIPLKNEIVDVAIMIITFHETQDREDYLKEVVRILKPGGIVFLIEFARFDSYILESLFDILHSGGEVDIPMIPYGGMDEKEIRKLMTPHLQDVRVERIKEVLIATGRKG